MYAIQVALVESICQMHKCTCKISKPLSIKEHTSFKARIAANYNNKQEHRQSYKDTVFLFTQLFTLFLLEIGFVVTGSACRMRGRIMCE